MFNLCVTLEYVEVCHKCCAEKGEEQICDLWLMLKDSSFSFFHIMRCLVGQNIEVAMQLHTYLQPFLFRCWSLLRWFFFFFFITNICSRWGHITCVKSYQHCPTHEAEDIQLCKLSYRLYRFIALQCCVTQALTLCFVGS